MSTDRFPAWIDPQRIFSSAGEIRSELELAGFLRLAGFLSQSAGSLKIDLHFGVDEAGHRMITGTLDASPTLRCQRCLQDVVFPVHSDLKVCVVDNDEEAASLPPQMESVVSESQKLDLLTLIEDELILSLPLAPRHEDKQCNAYLTEMSQEAEILDKQNTVKNGPFSGLRKLTDKQN